jgi:hypothetical protein
MKTRLLILALFMSAFSWGQSIFTNPITGTNPNTANPYTAGQTVAPNLTVSGIGRGTGIAGTGATDRYNANSWNTAAIDLNAYFEFILTPAPGYQIDFVSFVYTGQASGTGPTSFAFRSSVDGYASNIGTPTVAGTTISLAGAAYQGITSAITFRIYGWGTSASGGTFSINDFTFNGFVYSTTPSAPIITSDLNASAFVGVPFSYAITAINSPTSFNAVGLPAGFSINTTTGVITGTPGATGTFFVTITATNGTGFDEQTLILTITNPGPEINVRGATGGTNNIINGNIIPNAFNNTLFASIAVGANQDKDYRIENLGISNLTLTGVPRVQISGTHAADFTVITQPTSPIVSGANSVFVIRFSPSAGGVRNATVTIINNDSDEAPYTFAIQGGGLAPDINIVGNGNQVLSGSTIPDLNNHTNFGNVNEAGTTSKLRSFFIINLGGDILDITGVTITGTHAGDFSVTGVPSATVGLNNSTTLGITFDPSALGLREALVTITNNVPGKSPYTFAISGVGINFDECVIGGSSIFKTQTFEGATGTNVLGYTVATALGANPPVITGGTAFGGSRTVVSNKFLNNNSLQVTGPYPSTFDPKAKVIVTFDVVDTSIYQDVSFNVNIGAYSTNGTQGLDVSDWVTIFISGDGGLTWSREAIVKGNSNAIWNVFGGGTTFTNPFKGLDIPYEVQPTANSVGNGTRLLTLTNLPQVTQLQVKIELDIDRSDEVWVIDNVQLRGRLPVPKTWNGVWSGDGLPPTSVERAIFAANYNTSTNGDVIACECQINTGRIVTITDGGYVQSAGRIVNNGGLIVENNGSLVQLDDYAVNTGNATVRRTANIRRLDYVYWSSPVASFPVLNISPSTPAAVVFKWLPTIAGNFGNWTNANEIMVRGKGYIVRGPSTFNNTIQPFNAAFVGVPNNGIFTPTIERGGYTGGGYPSPTNPAITVTANDDNFNLLGNPYPSAISALDFLTENTNIEGSVRIWTHGLLPDVAFNDPFYNNFGYNYSPNDYIVHNGTGTVSGPLGFNGFIASGQGFFVLMNDGAAATETVTFKNSMRNVVHANNQFFRQSNQIQGEEDFKIWLDFIPQNGNPVRTLVGYVDGATNEKDRLFDASTKVDGSSKMYSLIDNKPFIIQGRAPFDENDRVAMGYNTTAAGRFTIAIADVVGLGDKKVYLVDKLLNIIHDLTENPYEFDSESGVFDVRFELRFVNEILSNPDFDTITSSVIAYGSDGQLNVKSTLQKITEVSVYDVLGRIIHTQKDQLTNEFVSNVNFTKQTVIVQIKLENGQVVTKKLMI